MEADRWEVLRRYDFGDFARKVVGVGSVGTEAFIMLLIGDRADEPLFLQVKEAQESVLAAFAGPSEYEHQGERVVMGQRLTQAATDPFLGWTTGAPDDQVSRPRPYSQTLLILERRGGCRPVWPVCGAYRADGICPRGGLAGGGAVPMIARGRRDLRPGGQLAPSASSRCPSRVSKPSGLRRLPPGARPQPQLLLPGRGGQAAAWRDGR